MANRINVVESLRGGKEALDMMDLLREGRARDLDPVKVSGLLFVLITQMNDLAKEVEDLTAAINVKMNIAKDIKIKKNKKKGR